MQKRKWVVVFKLNGKLQHTAPFDTQTDAEAAQQEIISQDDVPAEETIVRTKLQ
jgi:hypothetical protein